MDDLLDFQMFRMRLIGRLRRLIGKVGDEAQVVIAGLVIDADLNGFQARDDAEQGLKAAAQAGRMPAAFGAWASFSFQSTICLTIENPSFL